MITLPKSVFSADALVAASHAADFVFDMESFVGGGIEVSAYEQKEFSGWFLVHKIPRLNSLVAVVPENAKFAFKMRRRKMYIERFHLAPEESRAVDAARPKFDPEAGAGSASTSSSSSGKPTMAAFDF